MPKTGKATIRKKKGVVIKENRRMATFARKTVHYYRPVLRRPIYEWRLVHKLSAKLNKKARKRRPCYIVPEKRVYEKFRPRREPSFSNDESDDTSTTGSLQDAVEERRLEWGYNLKGIATTLDSFNVPSTKVTEKPKYRPLVPIEDDEVTEKKGRILQWIYNSRVNFTILRLCEDSYSS